MKGKQTYIEWSGFHYAMYFQLNSSRSEGTPRCGDIALDKPTSREVTFASNVWLWLALNDSWSSEVLLKELATIISR